MSNIIQTFGYILSEKKVQRAAVIPYTFLREIGKIYFLLGVDKKSGDITDFGGGSKINEFAIKTAMREFKEETNEIFNSEVYDINNKYGEIALLGKNMCCIFIPVDRKWVFDASRKFHNQSQTIRKKNGYDEISHLTWVGEDNFVHLISPGDNRMWRKIKNFYYKSYNKNFRDLLINSF